MTAGAAGYDLFTPMPLALSTGLHKINLAQEPWGFCFLLGGFAYFDDANALCGVNSLTIVPSPTVLHLIGPFAPLEPALNRL